MLLYYAATFIRISLQGLMTLSDLITIALLQLHSLSAAAASSDKFTGTCSASQPCRDSSTPIVPALANKEASRLHLAPPCLTKSLRAHRVVVLLQPLPFCKYCGHLIARQVFASSEDSFKHTTPCTLNLHHLFTGSPVCIAQTPASASYCSSVAKNKRASLSLASTTPLQKPVPHRKADPPSFFACEIAVTTSSSYLHHDALHSHAYTHTSIVFDRATLRRNHTQNTSPRHNNDAPAHYRA